MYFNVVLVLYLLVIVASEEALERFEYQGIHQGIHQVLNYKTLMVAEMVSSFSYTVYHYYVFFFNILYCLRQSTVHVKFEKSPPIRYF